MYDDEEEPLSDEQIEHLRELAFRHREKWDDDDIRWANGGEWPVWGRKPVVAPWDAEVLQEVELAGQVSALVTGEPIGREWLRAKLDQVHYILKPRVMGRLHELDVLSPQAYLLTLHAWVGSGFPNRALPHAMWREMFRRSGYTHDGFDRPQPTRPKRLYRGSSYEDRLNWSWTPDRELAAMYAQPSNVRPGGSVWVAKVEGWRLLGYSKETTEYVVDTEGLEVREA